MLFLDKTKHQSDWHVQPWVRVTAVLFIAAVVYVLLASSTSLFDRDEPRFARAAVEMLQSGDYVVPTFNQQLRPDKPPLTYWAMNLPLRLLGPTELAVRLPSIVGMLLAGWFTYLIGKAMFNNRTGLWAMIILLSSPLAVFMGTFATADGLLLAWSTLAVLAFVWILEDRLRWQYLLVMLIALTLGQLTKGPVAGLALVSVVLGSKGLMRSQLKLGRRFWVGFVLVLLASIGLFMAWFIPASVATDWQLARSMAGRHLLDRMVQPAEGHGGKGILEYVVLLPMYGLIILGTFFPWTMHLPAGLSAMIRRHVGTRRDRTVLWTWMGGVFIVFSLLATKLPHYVLPMYPAMALLCAATLDARARMHLAEKDRDWLRGGVWFFGPTAAVFFVGGLVGGALVLGTAAAWLLTPLVVLAVTAVLAIRWQLREKVYRSSRLLAAAVVVCLLMLLPALAWRIEPMMHDSPALATAVRQALDQHPQAPVFWSGYEEPTLAFYVNLPPDRQLTQIGRTPQALQHWSRQNDPAVLVVEADDWDQTQKQLGPLPITELHREDVWNYASEGRQMQVVVLLRDETSEDPER